MSGYDFTNEWFEKTAKPIWKALFPQINIRKILEVGSYEGASTCFLIETLKQSSNGGEIYAIDTWLGNEKKKREGVNMDAVEERFDRNIAYALKRDGSEVTIHKRKGYSDDELAKLYTEENMKGSFDFIYIDGSHEAHDVYGDAFLGFKLLKVGGVIAFDDYLWGGGGGPLHCPKIAIDAFTNIFARKIKFLQTANYQVYVQKIAD